MLKSRWTLWGILLGFALGGFFDGILLHQILQWHHLLSLVEGVVDLRVQVLWDGYFHALMYVLAAIALWGLWRSRLRADVASVSRLPAALAIGFGLWHIVDAVASHWVLGIHRIKVDSPSPLLWDLIWFSAFGVLPLILGRLSLRRPPPQMSDFGGSAAAVLVAAGLSALAGGWAMRPPSEQPFTTVVFPPGASARTAIAALDATGARLVWADSGMGVIVVDLPAAGRWEFYRRGALLVSGAALPAGCIDWSLPGSGPRAA
jgi:uncharacterized membrane protein